MSSGKILNFFSKCFPIIALATMTLVIITKKIIIIDDIKFEKIQVVRQLDTKQLMANKQTSHYAGFWQIITCDVIEGHGQTCIPILQSYTSSVFITEEDIITNQWTFLRNLNV